MALVLGLAGAVAGGSYAMLATKRYTVATDIVINPANLQVVDDDLFRQPNQVDSQLLAARSKQRILTSRNTLARVVDALQLQNDPEFASGGKSASAKSDPKLAALEKLQDSVRTEADENSFVTTLSVSAQSANKAIDISQSIVSSFQAELAKGEAEGASRAAAALDSRLDELKRDVQVAEEKVVAYRRAHKLSASNGQLVSTQTMTELNVQIVNAQARAAQARAAYETLVAGGADGTNANPNVSQTLAQLRTKASTLRQELDSQLMELGPRHPAILKLNVELDTVRKQVRAEFANNVEVAKANRDAANITLSSLESKLNDLQINVFGDTESEVALRELERDASTKTTIYESFLSRARQITERQQIDSTNVQVISQPVPPKGRSWPPRTIVLAGAGGFAGFALGLLLATAVGIRRDMRQPREKALA